MVLTEISWGSCQYLSNSGCLQQPFQHFQITDTCQYLSNSRCLQPLRICFLLLCSCQYLSNFRHLQQCGSATRTCMGLSLPFKFHVFTTDFFDNPPVVDLSLPFKFQVFAYRKMTCHSLSNSRRLQASFGGFVTEVTCRYLSDFRCLQDIKRMTNSFLSPPFSRHRIERL